MLAGAIFTPYAPVGLAGTPVVAAYFVAVLPFCAVGDLLFEESRRWTSK